MTDRIPCAVPFCRRTFSREKHPRATWMVCGDHWRMAPKRLRQAYSLMLRRYRRLPIEKPTPLIWRKFRQLERMAERVRDAAIAAAAAAPEMGAR